ncbi:transketolase [Candidatus Acetothermia bacterium]|jgi:transketolase|nr:transketolase [Candidatus Acetothermia bacterium]MCI2431521.1 transketolase [Candidatus Acetothermia bacterium]MCI2436191.1 transketolase [Candidatus Acetothermia bacterium]
MTISQLQQKAKELRRDVVQMIAQAQSGHPGGALGVADLLTVLYYKYLRHRSDEPRWPDRDRFVLSNGHICPILYAVLADRGYLPKAELQRLRKLGSILQGHPSLSFGTPGVEHSGGSLGLGLSVSVGMALAAKLDKKEYRVYCMISDGECQEGQTWEAAMSAAHYKLDNLCVILDRNGTQIDGRTEDIMSLEPLAEKWRAFGWNLLEIDGHDYEQIISAFEQFFSNQETQRPTLILARTVIGKGVSYMEGDYHWHHGAPNPQQLAQALQELS